MIVSEWKHKYRKKRQAVLDDNKDVGLEGEAEKTKYKFITPLQTTGQNLNLNAGNNFFKNVAKCEINYMGTNQNFI
jgi:hypothetical protein